MMNTEHESEMVKIEQTDSDYVSNAINCEIVTETKSKLPRIVSEWLRNYQWLYIDDGKMYCKVRYK